MRNRIWLEIVKWGKLFVRSVGITQSYSGNAKYMAQISGLIVFTQTVLCNHLYLFFTYGMNMASKIRISYPTL